MTRPNGIQMRAVIHMSGVINGADSESLHHCFEVLMSPSADRLVRAEALRQLRKLGGLIARFCDEYEQAEAPEQACAGRM
jgi:hypothetical protein